MRERERERELVDKGSRVTDGQWEEVRIQTDDRETGKPGQKKSPGFEHLDLTLTRSSQAKRPFFQNQRK